MNVREWALPVYTILMEVAVGGLLVLWVVRSLARSRFSAVELDWMIRNPLLVIVVTAFMGMAGAHLHLSKPWYSFLAILNVGHSWLSREVFFTVLFFLSVVLLWYLSRYEPQRQKLITNLGWLSILLGLAIVYCMSRLYVLTAQTAWNSWVTIASFYLTTFLLGVMTVACLMIMDMSFSEMQGSTQAELHARLVSYSSRGMSTLALGLITVDLVMIIVEVLQMQSGGTTAQASLALLLRLYLPLLILRSALLLVSALYIGSFIRRSFPGEGMPLQVMIPVYLATLLVFVAEIIGRFLFYAVHVRVGI
jgi:anaerobic dimethyl sulfoxide reductase subunit C (anchor subunit)